MKSVIIIIFALCSLGLAGQSPFLDGVLIGPNPVAPFSSPPRIFVAVDSFLSPYGYSMGLGCDGRYIWNDDAFTHSFARIDPVSHSVVNSFSPAYGNRDMAFDGTNLWASDWSTYCIYKYDTANCAILATYNPGFAGHAHGMAWDGNYLWVGEESGRIYKMNLTGDTLRSIPSPGVYPSNPRGLAFAGSHLWVGHQDYGYIYEIDTVTGAVINTYNAPGFIAGWRFQQGLDFDGQYLWSTVGGDVNMIYKIDIGLVKVDEGGQTPTDGIKMQVYPNPIRANSRISFTLRESAVVRLTIIDGTGRFIAGIVDQQTMGAGQYHFDCPFEKYPNGVYFAVLKVNDQSRAIKVIKL